MCVLPLPRHIRSVYVNGYPLQNTNHACNFAYSKIVAIDTRQGHKFHSTKPVASSHKILGQCVRIIKPRKQGDRCFGLGLSNNNNL